MTEVLRRVSTTRGEIEANKEKIRGTQINEDKGLKMTHTFNPKSNMRTHGPASRFAEHKHRRGQRGLDKTHTRRSSIFEYSDQSRERDRRHSKGAAKPPLDSREVYSDESDDPKKVTSVGRDAQGTPHRNLAYQKLKIRVAELGAEAGEEEDGLRKRVKTCDYGTKNPFLYNRASTVARLEAPTPKTHSRMKLETWKDQAKELAINEDTNEFEGARRDQSCTSIVEDAQTPNRSQLEQVPESVEAFKRKFWSENVLDKMGRQQTPGGSSRMSVADFQVVGELGQGHFGKVLLVRRESTKDEFAVKLIPMTRSLDAKEEENLLSEARIFEMISNRFVVKAFYW